MALKRTESAKLGAGERLKEEGLKGLKKAPAIFFDIVVVDGKALRQVTYALFEGIVAVVPGSNMEKGHCIKVKRKNGRCFKVKRNILSFLQGQTVKNNRSSSVKTALLQSQKAKQPPIVPRLKA